jgi:nucleotide-binding universal stress UspA family protein
MRIAKILVPTDFSENAQAAFEKACDLALQLRVKLYVLHIQDGSALRVAIKEELLSADSTNEQLQVTVQQVAEYMLRNAPCPTLVVRLEHTRKRV